MTEPKPIVRRAFVPTVAFYEECDPGAIGEFYRKLRKLFGQIEKAQKDDEDH